MITTTATPVAAAWLLDGGRHGLDNPVEVPTEGSPDGVPGAREAMGRPCGDVHTAIELFRHRVAASGGDVALRYREGGSWRSITWTEWDQVSRDLACGLLALGLSPGDRAGLIAATRPEWLLLDVAILRAGGVTVPIYESMTAAMCGQLVNDAGARVVVVEDPHQLEKLLTPAVRRTLGGVVQVILIDEVRDFARPDAKGRIRLRVEELLPPGHPDRAWVTTLRELRTTGTAWQAERPGALEGVAEQITPEHAFSIVYTSGASGPPKGVVLTHRNLCFECQALYGVLPITSRDEQLLQLPLAHILGRVLAWGAMAVGCRTAIASRPARLLEDLREARPTFAGSVPVTFERLQRTIEAELARLGRHRPFGRTVIGRAFALGRRRSGILGRGERPSTRLEVEAMLSDRLVFARFRRAFGGRQRFFICGGAPLGRETAEFFHAMGVLILEGYGLTETTAPTHVNRPDAFRFGTVGLPIPGVEVRLAPDGEILLRGGGVFREYWRDPEATSAAKDQDGWFHSGDIGEIDGDGFLRITDRKKDIVVTAGGKTIAPQNLENGLKALSPYVANVYVHGDRRPFLTALITLNEAPVVAWAKAEGIAFANVAELSVRPEVRGLIQHAVDRLNATLAPYEIIRRFAILPRDFSHDTGELTPTGKLRRRECAAKYATRLDRLYEG